MNHHDYEAMQYKTNVGLIFLILVAIFLTFSPFVPWVIISIYEWQATQISDSTRIHNPEKKKNMEEYALRLTGFNQLNPTYINSVKVCSVIPPYFTGGGGYSFIQLEIATEHFDAQCAVLDNVEKTEKRNQYTWTSMEKYDPKWWNNIHKNETFAVVLSQETHWEIYFWIDESEHAIYAFQDTLH